MKKFKQLNAFCLAFVILMTSIFSSFSAFAAKEQKISVAVNGKKLSKKVKYYKVKGGYSLPASITAKAMGAKTVYNKKKKTVTIKKAKTTLVYKINSKRVKVNKKTKKLSVKTVLRKKIPYVDGVNLAKNLGYTKISYNKSKKLLSINKKKASPSVEPSVVPTEFQTGAPTVAPTAAPNISATGAPTKAPTAAPTATPYYVIGTNIVSNGDFEKSGMSFADLGASCTGVDANGFKNAIKTMPSVSNVNNKAYFIGKDSGANYIHLFWMNKVVSKGSLHEIKFDYKSTAKNALKVEIKDENQVFYEWAFVDTTTEWQTFKFYTNLTNSAMLEFGIWVDHEDQATKDQLQNAAQELGVYIDNISIAPATLVKPTPIPTATPTPNPNATPTPTGLVNDMTIYRVDVNSDDPDAWSIGGKEPYFDNLRGTVSTSYEGLAANDKAQGKHLNAQPCEFGGRGNSTWFYSFNWQNPSQSKKLAYKVEFDEKVNMLDIPGAKAKKWVLLAMRFDKSLMRTSLVFDLAQQLSFQFTPRYRFANVYVNGQYKGLYMVTDQIEAGGPRADLKTEDTETDTEPGFLLEWDFKILNEEAEKDPNNPGQYLKPVEGVDYFRINVNNNGSVPFAYKGPKVKDLNKVPNDAARTYIKNYMTNMSNAIADCGNNNNYLNYINVTTFYDYFICAEFAKNLDAASHSSIYLTKPKGEKLMMGPLWDYDLTFGYEHNTKDPEGWHIRYGNGWYNDLISKNATFRVGLKNRWNEVKHLIREKIIDGATVQSNKIRTDANKNHQLWNELNVRLWPTGDNQVSPYEPCFDTYQGYVDQLINWAEDRYVWMDQKINTWTSTHVE